MGITAGQAQPTDPPAQITVDAGKSLGFVNKAVFGHSVEAGDSAGIFKGAVTSPAALISGNGYWNPVTRQPVASVLKKCHDIGLSVLRYPGGSLANNYNWKKTIGPVEKRGDWHFGVDEYVELCRQLGAEPLFTVSDYLLPADQMPKHNAELVEYLNSPATPDHPWAMKRKEYGHPEPFGVKWFELGNESSGGNCEVQPHRQYTPEQYARYAIACSRAMKAVDPSIKIGIVTSIGTKDPNCAWNQTVIREAGPEADFVIVHEYAPSATADMPVSEEDRLMRACMATADQYEKLLQDYHAVIKKQLGKDLPIAITEYNGGGDAQTPKPYRFSYAVGLECADLLRMFLKPENNIFAANYWQLMNGYFGMLRTEYDKPDGGVVTEKAAFPLYRLWGQHFGVSLVSTSVAGPTAPFEGMVEILPAMGKVYQNMGSLGFTSMEPAKEASMLSGPGFTTQWTGADSLTITLNNFTKEAYPQLGLVTPVAGKTANQCDYRLTFEARYVPDPTATGTQVMPLGLEIVDGRGWNATGSIAQIGGVGQPEWKPFSSEQFHTLNDAESVTFNAILAAGVNKMSGKMEVRHIKVEALGKTIFPEYALLTCSASLSPEENTLYLIVFNKSDAKSIPAHINLQSFPATSAKLWQVNAPALNSFEGVSEVATGENLPCAKDGFDYKFPAHSMTAIELQQ